MDVQCIVFSSGYPMSGDVLEAYLQLYVRAFPGHTVEEIRAQTGHEIARGDRFILLFSTTLLGFVTWELHGGSDNRLAELEHIATDPHNPEARGLGRQLIEILELHVHDFYRRFGQPGARKIWLLTHENNTRAQNLYLRCGFKHTATLLDFWHDGVNEFYFEKNYPDEV